MTHARSGFVLITSIGLSMSLLVLSLVYLQTMRSDAERIRVLEQEATCRIMLAAGIFYVQESSRIGWSAGNPTTGWHQEAFGWRDIRDGRLAGPRDVNGLPLWTPGSGQWPDPGSTTRNVMYPMIRPPFAVATSNHGNPIPWDNMVGTNNSYAAAIHHHNPFPSSVSFPDPPVNWTAAERDAAWMAHCQGDRRPRNSGSYPWFRLLRRPAPNFDTFLITCGSGGTFGFRDWSECLAFNSDVRNANQPEYQAIQDPETFATIRAQERLLWYEIRWSPAVTGRQGTSRGNQTFSTNVGSRSANMVSAFMPPNAGATSPTTSNGMWDGNAKGAINELVNQGGTVSYVQRIPADLVGTSW